MKAYTITNSQDHSLTDIHLTTVDRPVPGPDQVLIKVHAAGLNPVDYKVVEGGVDAWHFPHILGLDVAGEIVAVGKQVQKWQVGMRVSGHSDLTKDGCFAEYIAVPSYQLALIPDNVSYETAASLLCGALTAYQAINRKPNLATAKTALIHAGAGGVGSMAIQFAKLRGLKVFTTVSSRKVGFVRQLHPDAIIDYQKEDVTSRIMELTADQGADLIVDTVGKAEATADLHRLSYNGTLVTIVEFPTVDPDLMFNRGLTVATVNLGGAHLSKNPVQQRDLGQMDKEVLQLASQGKVKSLIERVLPFDQLVHGLQMIKDRQVMGKLVVKID